MFDMKWCIGRVEKKMEGPENAVKYPYRVRVRIFGVHDVFSDQNTPADSSTGRGIPTDDLPLAYCLYPVIFNGIANGCPPPALEPGAIVLCLSLDGNLFNELLIVGCIPGAEGLNDLSKNAGNTGMGNAQENRLGAFGPIVGDIITGQATTGQIMSGIQSFSSSGNNSLLQKNGITPIKYGETTKFGLYQVDATTAAQMMLQNDGMLKGVSGNLDSNLKEGLQYLASNGNSTTKARALAGEENAESKTLWEAVEKYPALQQFIELINSNYLLNKALGENLLATCQRFAKDDPLFSIFLYHYGIEEGMEVLQKLGYDKGLPEKESYASAFEKLCNIDSSFKEYATTVLSKAGGIENLDYGRDLNEL